MRLRLPPPRGRGPLAIAAFIGIPLFFCSLMSSTLAQEKPLVHQWKGCKAICTTWHEPTSATEARIWLWAMVPSVLLTLIGYACTRIPYGWYVACAAGIVEAMAVVHRVSTWSAHHVQRFPWGADLIPGTNGSSNQYDAGEWEKIARETALSLEHWTIGLALASIAVMAALYVRRRFFARAPLFALEEDGIVESVHAPDVTSASVPIE
jgi:hypothetical protein